MLGRKRTTLKGMVFLREGLAEMTQRPGSDFFIVSDPSPERLGLEIRNVTVG